MEFDSQEELPWRRNAAAVIVDSAGRVLLGKAPGEYGYWHFPQGGALGDEDIETTVRREVFEEVGLRDSLYRIVQSLDGLRYRYRPDHRRIRKWSGQQQTYFLLVCDKEKPRTKLSQGKEFVRTRWSFPADIHLEMFSPSKRKVIETVLSTFLGMTPDQMNPVPTAPSSSEKKGKSSNKKRQVKTVKKTKENDLAKNQKKTSVSQPVLLLTKQYLPSLHNMDINRYLVKPGSKLKLSDYDSSDRSLFNGSKEESFVEFNQLREEMQHLQKLLFAENKRKILVIIQAMDTGGKDGCIRHVFGWIDPQGINVVAFKKPSEEELGHDFLWRVHKAAPGAGQITIFNRSHYEDIIAVRARNLFPEARWRNRYRHVLEFERMLADEGTVIIKLFLNISKTEQKYRIEQRLQNPDKYWKFHMDDLADRSMWDTYQDIYTDVMEKTSTEHAPWYIIPADRKWYRNLVVARLVVDVMHKMNIEYPKVNFDPSKIVVPD